MEKQQNKSSVSNPLQAKLARRAIEGLFVLSIALAVYFVLALITYDSRDPAWSAVMDMQQVHNAAGVSGAWIADVLFSLIGYVAYLIPLLLLYRAWLFFRLRDSFSNFEWAGLFIALIGMLLVIISLCGLFGINNNPNNSLLPFGNGGVLGNMLGEEFLRNFGLSGGRLFLFSLFFLGITIFTDISWMRLIENVGKFVTVTLPMKFALLMRWLKQKAEQRQIKKAEKKAERQQNILLKPVKEKREPTMAEVVPAKQTTSEPEPKEEKSFLSFADLGRSKPKAEVKPEFEAEPAAPARIEPTFSKPVESKPPVAVVSKPAREISELGDELPELSLLLKAPTSEKMGYSQETLDRLSRLLEEKLLDFRIEATVMDVIPGPVVTCFEIQPAPGIKASSITNLARDIARSLAVISVRVVEVIPGKTVIGIEIPNEDRQIVYFSEVVDSAEFADSTSPLTLALGHDISGQPIVADLGKMPHLLVAGTTGSGKSVGVNAMLLSMLFKATPQEVRLMLVDPKMLELSVYEGIPHLLTPVITDMKDAANGLRWCVGEMERRYQLLSKLGVRNIAGFNRKILEAAERGETIPDPLWKPEENFVPGYDIAPAPDLETLPYIVVVIDEFADMIMVVGKKVEELIARIAQKARAAGIHLILATQRPSVDVITGLIKANVPTRMAFQVSSKIDSRTILDQAGAEQLLGHGDMLYMPPGSSSLVRVHGAFVDDDEVHRVVASWKEIAEPNYIENLLDDGGSHDIPGIPGEAAEDGDAESDPLYDEAVAFVLESRKASISAVQRKLRVGYNRAARMIESMEAAGLVSNMGHNGQREVLAPSSSPY